MRISAWAAGLAIATFASLAQAQQYMVGGAAEVMTGVEGGVGSFKIVPQRARTTLRLGGDLSIDEFPKDIVSAAVLLEIEPKASAGLDVRYARLFGNRLTAGVGAIGILLPKSLIGGSFDVQARFRLASRLQLTVGPMINIFVVGSDLPDNSVVWQGMLRVGIHANL